MSIDEWLLQLDRAVVCLNGSYDAAKTDARLKELIAAMHAGTAVGRDYEEHGRLSQQHAEFLERRQLLDEAAYFCRDAKIVEESEFARTETQRALESAAEFILGQKLAGKYDLHGAIVTLHVLGTYGYANRHMELLAEAYEGFVRRKEGFLSERIYESENEIALGIKGEKAFGYFRSEHGIHRVEYEREKVGASGGKPQTDRITVKVEPYLNGKSSPLDEKDLLFEHLGSHGTGGGGSDTSNYGIRVTHRPTGITAVSRLRRQDSNYKLALRVLASRVAASAATQQDAELRAFANPADAGIVRTYNFIGTQFIKDQRSRFETRDVKEFFEGGIEPMIRAYHGIDFLK
jgi:protein subunit release factor A